MIIFDENVEQYWIDLISSAGFDYISIREGNQGISDLQVVELVKRYQGLLITEDKDFGELVFAFGVRDLSILFLRYDQPQYDQIEESLLEILKRYLNGEVSGFITITRKKIRIRRI
jgi:predicted nuclease of predicted toxin-antitoxin system